MLQVIDGIELLRGWPLSPTEQEDFLHLWAVIGWAIGVEDECNPCYRGVAHAQAMLDSIMMVCPRPTFSLPLQFDSTNRRRCSRLALD